MTLITGSIPSDCLITLTTLVVVFVTYFKWSFTYWTKRNIFCPRPEIPFGNLQSFFARTMSQGQEWQLFYNEFKKKGLKHGGIFSFTNPIYIPVHLDYIKNVLTKDAQHFIDRGRYYNEKDDPISGHMFNISGAKWRDIRTKVSPAFTTGKIKTMFNIVLECAGELKNSVEACGDKKIPIETKEAAGSYSMDVIGSCAFGLNCNAIRNPNCDFNKNIAKVSPNTISKAVKHAFMFSFQDFSKFIGLCSFDKDMNKFYMNIVKDTLEYREKNNVTRNDFMQVLMDLKENNNQTTEQVKFVKRILTVKEIAAQTFVFFFAGFDTSSSTIAFCLYEMASNQGIQDKLREEIEQMLMQYDGKLTYEGIAELQYLQQVIDETLRKYPPLPFLNRKCIKEYHVPDTNVIIEKNTHVIIPILGIHWDPEYYPNPEVFDPERFSPENKRNRNPYSYLSFGEGPRVCIGVRFAMMQMKVGLVLLLKNFRFTVNAKTQLPLEFGLGLMTSVKKGIWLDVEKIITT